MNFLEIDSFKDLADFLSISTYQLKGILYVNNHNYHHFTLPKRGGGKRDIKAPHLELKIIQKTIADELYKIYPSPNCSYGFVKNKSIVGNAMKHVGKSFVFNIDLKDFFPSIHSRRVRGLFMAYPFKFNVQVAHNLAKICCEDRVLPQGAPTSPILSNLIAWKMDKQLMSLARDNACHYTRYADDITFSTTKNSFPPAIADQKKSGKWVVGKKLRGIIKENDFEINNEKVRLQNRNERQEVTGLIVNEQLNVRRKFIREIRGALNAWDTHGYDKANTVFIKKYYDKKIHPDRKQPELHEVLRGKIEHLRKVRGTKDPLFLYYFSWLCQLMPSYQKDEVDDKILELNYEKHKFIIDYLQFKFEQVEQISDAQDRGLAFERFLNLLFKGFNLAPSKSFKITGEQIDGSFYFGNDFFLLEAKWQKDPCNARDFYGLEGKVDRKSKWSAGIFISMSGFSEEAKEAIQKKGQLNIIAINGVELKYILTNEKNLQEILKLKLRKASQTGNVFYEIY